MELTFHTSADCERDLHPAYYERIQSYSQVYGGVSYVITDLTLGLSLGKPCLLKNVSALEYARFNTPLTPSGHLEVFPIVFEPYMKTIEELWDKPRELFLKLDKDVPMVNRLIYPGCFTQWPNSIQYGPFRISYTEVIPAPLVAPNIPILLLKFTTSVAGPVEVGPDVVDLYGIFEVEPCSDVQGGLVSSDKIFVKPGEIVEVVTSLVNKGLCPGSGTLTTPVGKVEKWLLPGEDIRYKYEKKVELESLLEVLRSKQLIPEINPVKERILPSFREEQTWEGTVDFEPVRFFHLAGEELIFVGAEPGGPSIKVSGRIVAKDCAVSGLAIKEEGTVPEGPFVVVSKTLEPLEVARIVCNDIILIELEFSEEMAIIVDRKIKDTAAKQYRYVRSPFSVLVKQLGLPPLPKFIAR